MIRGRSSFTNAIFLFIAVVASTLYANRQAAAQSNAALLSKFCAAKDIRGSECLNAKYFRDGETCIVDLTSKRFRGKVLSPPTPLLLVGYSSPKFQDECGWSMHTYEYEGLIAFELRGNSLVFRGFISGLVMDSCTVVPRNARQDRLICIAGEYGRGFVTLRIGEIAFSRDSSKKLKWTFGPEKADPEKNGFVQAGSSAGALGAERVDCEAKANFVLFDVGNLRRGPAPDTLSIEASYADAQVIKRACDPSTPPPKDAYPPRLGQGNAFVDESAVKKGRLIVDLRTKEIVAETDFRKRR